MAPLLQRSFPVVVFQLEKWECALVLDSVREVVHMAELMHPPGLPHFLAGFLNLSGSAIPVISLRHLLNLPEQPVRLYTPLLVVPGKIYPLAFIVDTVTEVVSIPSQMLLPVEKNLVFNDCLAGEIVIRGRTIYLLLLERLLIKEEQYRIEALQMIAQRRLGELARGVS